MPSYGVRKGCHGAGKGATRPKTQHPDRPSAFRQLQWMVENLGCYEPQMRVYECRYSEPGEPHFHVGHIPGSKRGQARRKR